MERSLRGSQVEKRIAPERMRRDDESRTVPLALLGVGGRASSIDSAQVSSSYCSTDLAEECRHALT